MKNQKKDPMSNNVEPILTENPDRFVIFPIKHDDLWEWYKKCEACFWTAEEIDLSEDLNEWNNKLNEDERYFVKHILAFFGFSQRTQKCFTRLTKMVKNV